MALNYSHRPVFPPRLSDENLVSPIRSANGYGISERNNINNNAEDNPFSAFVGGDIFETRDIVDRLPPDPFGMTAITGWLGDLQIDYDAYCYGYSYNEVASTSSNNNNSNNNNNSYDLISNIFHNAMMLGGNMVVPVDQQHGFGWVSTETFNNDSGSSGPSVNSNSNKNNNINSRCGDMDSPLDDDEEEEEHEGVPHEAVSFSLAYLGIRDLLNTERVCKSLRSAVREDSLLWTSIQVGRPLNDKITDDVLLGLAGRAHGNLRSLSLVECPRITDDALRRVLESNLKLTKLSVPGSTRISVEGLISSLRAAKSKGAPGLKQIRIGGLYGVTAEHFEELKELLDKTESHNNSREEEARRKKPHFYGRQSLYLPSDDDRDIDVELCPRCHNLRLVYDCPLENADQYHRDHFRHHGESVCRACALCVARCAACGQCIDDNEYEETFCLELLCSVCGGGEGKEVADQPLEIDGQPSE